MILIPYRRIGVNTNRNPSAVVARLRPKLATYKPLLGSPVGAPEFYGRVTENRITIVPVVSERFIYSPYTTGRIIPTASGCTLVLTQTLKPVAAVQWLAFALVPMFLAFQSSSLEGILSWLVLFLVLHAGMCVFLFRPEARRTETLLKELLANQAL